MSYMNLEKSTAIQSRVIDISSFWAQFAISMVNLALVYHMRIRFGLSAQLVGLSAAVYTSTYFLCCILLGSVASRLRPRHSVMLSMGVMALAQVVVIVTNSVLVAFMALILYGIGMSFLWPQIEGWLARGKEGRDLNKATSSFNVAWSLGAALSPLLTGILLEQATVAPLLAGIALFISVYLIIAIATRLVPAIRAVESEHVTVQQSQVKDASTPLRFLSWAGVLTVYASLAVTLTIFPMHAMDNLPFSETVVGILLLIRGVSTVIMFIVMGKSSSWHFNRSLVIITQFMVAAVCLFGTMVDSFAGLALFFLLFGILFAMAYSYSIFHGASGSVNRSSRMLIHEVLLTIGTVIGSIVGGTLYQYIDYSMVLYACAVLVSVPALFSLVRSFARKAIH